VADQAERADAGYGFPEEQADTAAGVEPKVRPWSASDSRASPNASEAPASLR
jgi:hypothetical protein